MVASRSMTIAGFGDTLRIFLWKPRGLASRSMGLQPWDNFSEGVLMDFVGRAGKLGLALAACWAAIGGGADVSWMTIGGATDVGWMTFGWGTDACGAVLGWTAEATPEAAQAAYPTASGVVRRGFLAMDGTEAAQTAYPTASGGVRLILLPIVGTEAVQAADPPASPSGMPVGSAPPSGSAEEDFQKIFRQWKGLLEELRRLAEEYRIAEPARRAEIVPLYRQQLQKSEALLPRLVEAAEKAYQQTLQPEGQLQDFLLAYFYERVVQDDYEIAYRIGSLLLRRGCKDRRLTNMTAYAAFCVQEYDEAWQLFQKAKQEGTFRPLDRKDVLNATVEEFLRNPDPFRQAWQRELQFRQAEQQADDLPRVRLRTNRGDLVLELFEDQAPNTVANFISLVERGFYNGLTFHRVIEGFMAQGGCPKGDGTGGPGYKIACECYQPNRRQHFRGVVSMAHAGRDTGGSQFFITFVPTPNLDSRIDPQTGQPELDPQTGRPYVGHTVFGRVIEGMEVLAKLQRRSPTNPDAPPADKILKAVVLRKRPHPYVPQKIEPEEKPEAPGSSSPSPDSAEKPKTQS